MLAPAKAKPTDPAVAKAREEETAAAESLGSAKALTPEGSAAIDRLLSSTSGAMSVLLRMDAAKLPPLVRDAVVARSATAKDEVRDLFEPFIPADQLVKRLGPTFEPQQVLTLPGDAARGRQVFFETSGGLCSQCHQVADKGVSFGPDLTHIAAKYDRAALLDNIVFPSKTIDPAFVTYAVKTATDEDPIVGLVVEKTPQEVVVKTPAKELKRIRAADVKKMTPLPTSAMPEGLLSGLTAQQAADLIEFLAQQK